MYSCSPLSETLIQSTKFIRFLSLKLRENIDIHQTFAVGPRNCNSFEVADNDFVEAPAPHKLWNFLTFNAPTPKYQDFEWFHLLQRFVLCEFRQDFVFSNRFRNLLHDVAHPLQIYRVVAIGSQLQPGGADFENSDVLFRCVQVEKLAATAHQPVVEDLVVQLGQQLTEGLQQVVKSNASGLQELRIFGLELLDLRDVLLDQRESFQLIRDWLQV